MRQCELKDNHTGIEYDWLRKSNAKKPERQPETRKWDGAFWDRFQACEPESTPGVSYSCEPKTETPIRVLGSLYL